VVTRFPGQLEGPTDVRSLPFLLRRACAVTDRLLRDAARSAGLGELNATGLQILVLVRSGRTAASLAESLGISHQATARVLADLEGKDLVWRMPDPFDGRVKVVRLTDEGERTALEIREALEGALDELSDDLEPGRLEALVRDLEVVAEIGTEAHPWERW
jgi:MarR family transcriptional regulator for hemolysin